VLRDARITRAASRSPFVLGERAMRACVRANKEGQGPCLGHLEDCAPLCDNLWFLRAQQRCARLRVRTRGQSQC
jgi:hypothetical protein